MCIRTEGIKVKIMKGGYITKARVFPAVLTMIPFMVLYMRVLSPVLDPVLEPVWNYLPLVAGVSIHAVLLYAFVQLNRFLSKVIFQEWLFGGDLKMPTTDMLLQGNALLDKQTRERYYSLIQQDFDIDMQKSLSKLKTEKEKRLMITRVVGRIRPMLKDNDMVQQHNREFGFIRNLEGGSIGAVTISIALIVIAICQHDSTLMGTAVIMAVVYFVILLLSKVLIVHYGKNYAYVLFEQYECLHGRKLSEK